MRTKSRNTTVFTKNTEHTGVFRIRSSQTGFQRSGNLFGKKRRLTTRYTAGGYRPLRRQGSVLKLRIQSTRSSIGDVRPHSSHHGEIPLAVQLPHDRAEPQTPVLNSRPESPTSP